MQLVQSEENNKLKWRFMSEMPEDQIKSPFDIEISPDYESSYSQISGSWTLDSTSGILNHYPQFLITLTPGDKDPPLLARVRITLERIIGEINTMKMKVYDVKDYLKDLNYDVGSALQDRFPISENLPNTIHFIGETEMTTKPEEPSVINVQWEAKGTKYLLIVPIAGQNEHSGEYTITALCTDDPVVEGRHIMLEHVKEVQVSDLINDVVDELIRDEEQNRAQLATDSIKLTIEVDLGQITKEVRTILDDMKIMLLKCRQRVAGIDQNAISEITAYKKPPDVIFATLKACVLILGLATNNNKLTEWNGLKVLVKKDFLKKIMDFDPTGHYSEVRFEDALQLLTGLDEVTVFKKGSKKAAIIFEWVKAVIEIRQQSNLLVLHSNITNIKR
jgi:hypothetical protein